MVDGTPVGSALTGTTAGAGALVVASVAGALGEVSGEDRFRSLARETWVHTLRACAHPSTAPKEIGAFQGWTGVVLARAHLAALWGAVRIASRT